MQGCSEEEIVALELEKTCGLTLPVVYREFLRLLGKQTGRFLVGSSAGPPTSRRHRWMTATLCLWSSEGGEQGSDPPSVSFRHASVEDSPGRSGHAFCIDRLLALASVLEDQDAIAQVGFRQSPDLQ